MTSSLGGTVLNMGRTYLPLMNFLIPMLLTISAMAMTIPSLTDVTVQALCSSDNCSFAVYLSGVQAFVSSVGAIFMTPYIGGLSDKHGRKPFLLLTYALGMLPICVLAWSTTMPYVYAFYGLRAVVGWFTEGLINCLIGACVADIFLEHQRPIAYGGLGACFSAGYLGGTVLGRIVPLHQIYIVSGALQVCALVYLLLMLPETAPCVAMATHSGPAPELSEHSQVASRGATVLRSKSSMGEAMILLDSNRTLKLILGISFLSALAEQGQLSTSMYYLKAAFHFSKDQFADMMLISAGSTICSQIVILPVFLMLLPLKYILIVGLASGALEYLIMGFAWAPWVPYFASAMSALVHMNTLSVGTILSQSVPSDQQGRLQGIAAGLRSLASAISPIVFNPVTAVFLSDQAPFYCPGFGVILGGVVMALAFGTGLNMPRQERAVIREDISFVAGNVPLLPDAELGDACETAGAPKLSLLKEPLLGSTCSPPGHN